MFSATPLARAQRHRVVPRSRLPTYECRPISSAIKLGEGTTVWVEDEIDQWLARRVAERDSGDGDAAAV